MRNIDFSKLKMTFKPKVSKNKRAPTVDDTVPDKRLTKLVVGLVNQVDNDNYTVTIKYFDFLDRLAADVKISDIGKNAVTLPFTKDSYDMSKSERVFTKVGQQNREYISLIRNESDRIFKSPDPNRYVPFCHRWLCSCWIVRIKGKLYAKFNKILTIAGHNYKSSDLKDEDNEV